MRLPDHPRQVHNNEVPYWNQYFATNNILIQRTAWSQMINYNVLILATPTLSTYTNILYLIDTRSFKQHYMRIQPAMYDDIKEHIRQLIFVWQSVPSSHHIVLDKGLQPVYLTNATIEHEYTAWYTMLI